MLKIIVCFTVFFMTFNSIQSESRFQIGDKGYGITVFKGWDAERFNVEIVDVMKNIGPGNDIILARLSGNGLEKSGVIAGMSGSPVYINNQLIGALAYAWPGSTEPICGITPIEAMHREWQNQSTYPITLSKELSSITTPVYASGFDNRVLEYIKKSIVGINQSSGEGKANINNYFIPSGSMESSSSMSNGNYKNNLKGGDAVAIQFVKGDYSLQGIGTVTYVSNNAVYIFGHPMDLAGDVSLPISRAYIYSIIPSNYLSFKLGASSETIGATTYDGKNGVYCELNKEADTSTVDLEIIKDNKKFHYTFEIAMHPAYFSTFLSGAVSQSVLNHLGYMEDRAISLRLNLSLMLSNTLYNISNQMDLGYDPGYFNHIALLQQLQGYFSIYSVKEFGKIKLDKIRILINIDQSLSYYSIDKVNINQELFRPGDRLVAKIILKKHRGVYEERQLDLVIPADLPKGQYRVVVANEYYLDQEIQRSFPESYHLRSFQDLVLEAGKFRNAKKLTLALIAAKNGFRLNDVKMEHFPEQYRYIWNDRLNSDDNLSLPYTTSRGINLDGVVFGTTPININIQSSLIKSVE